MALATSFDLPVVFPRNSDVNNLRFLACALRKFLSSFSRADSSPEGDSLRGVISTINVRLVSFSTGPWTAVAIQRGSAA
jgi:hypothetical protein